MYLGSGEWGVRKFDGMTTTPGLGQYVSRDQACWGDWGGLWGAWAIWEIWLGPGNCGGCIAGRFWIQRRWANIGNVVGACGVTFCISLASDSFHYQMYEIV